MTRGPPSVWAASGMLRNPPRPPTSPDRALGSFTRGGLQGLGVPCLVPRLCWDPLS